MFNARMSSVAFSVELGACVCEGAPLPTPAKANVESAEYAVSHTAIDRKTVAAGGVDISDDLIIPVEGES